MCMIRALMINSSLLKSFSLFEGLPQADLEHIAECLHEKSFRKGELVFMAGASCERVFIVQSGTVKVFRASAETGREQVLETLGPGQTCACHTGEDDLDCSSSGEALTDCKIWYLSAPDFARLVHTKPSVSLAMNRIFSGRLHCLSSLVEAISLKDVRSRLIRFLLEWPAKPSADKKGGSLLELTVTREEIAGRIGTARETVARTLHQLKEEGLIDILAHQIVIKNRSKMESQLTA